MQEIREHLRDILGSIPDAPGVYEFLGDQGEVLYIGKSKCLRRTPGKNGTQALPAEERGEAAGRHS